MSFTPNIPLATQSLGQTRQNIVDNMAILRSTLAVDHVDVNASPNGYHKVIHYQNQGSNPATIAGVGQLFTKTANGSQQLFYRNGSGDISQLTGSAITGTDDGYQWLGSILIQWGRVDETTSTGATTGSVTFASRAANMIAFPTNCFSVMTTPTSSQASTPNSQMSIAIKRTLLSATGFTYVEFTNSSDYRGFRWIAIGN